MFVRRVFRSGVAGSLKRTFSSSSSSSSSSTNNFKKSTVLAAAAMFTATTAGYGIFALAAPKKSVEPVPTTTSSSTATAAAPPKPTPPPELPVEMATITFAPEVPPPIERDYPVRLVVEMNSTQKVMQLSPIEKFTYWTFNDAVPGPFIRARLGDTLEVRYKNEDATGLGHNIDFHAVTGPGGGAPMLNAEQEQTRIGSFKLLQPGLFVYHCAAGPVPAHVANGMYGLILVEPSEGLPKVDKEFYVMQSEFYTEDNGNKDGILDYSHSNGLKEHPSHVVFNGRVAALTESPLLVPQHKRVRIFFGNGGPNLVSSFHVIGTIFDKVYREGDVISPPARALQTTLVPAGGATIVEMDMTVPGNYTLVDHSIFRIEKGAIGFLKVIGPDDHKEIYTSRDGPNPCPDCKLHN